MPKLNIDELLVKNPQVDAEAVKRRQHQIEESGPRQTRAKQWPLSPYGRQKRGDSRWSDKTQSRHSRRV